MNLTCFRLSTKRCRIQLYSTVNQFQFSVRQTRWRINDDDENSPISLFCLQLSSLWRSRGRIFHHLQEKQYLTSDSLLNLSPTLFYFILFLFSIYLVLIFLNFFFPIRNCNFCFTRIIIIKIRFFCDILWFFTWVVLNL